MSEAIPASGRGGAVAPPDGGRAYTFAGPDPDPVRAEYAAGGPSLFWLALRMALLSVITLGLYRFWMRTRLRRHYWSRVRVMGDPFEYTGTGIEKLLGFLLALVILAVYLTIVNLGLAFMGLANFDDPVQLQIVINLSVLASLPLIFFATYRAKRYLAARTRWRGIRFGMDQGSWGYTGRALLLSLVTLVTLGLLYPLQHFRLTKFTWDRTWFGDQRFHQDGRWTGLFGYWIWLYLIIAVIAASAVFVALDPDNPGAILTVGLAGSLGYFAILLLAVRYRVAAFRYLWNNRSLGHARFDNDVDTGEVIGIYIAGSMAIGMCAVFLGLLAMGIAAGIWFILADPATIDALQNAEDNPAALQAAWPLFAGLALGYLLMIALAFAFTQIFVTRPILRRQAGGMRIAHAASLAESRQRSHDEALEAGGFADALGVDVGAGF